MNSVISVQETLSSSEELTEDDGKDERQTLQHDQDFELQAAS